MGPWEKYGQGSMPPGAMPIGGPDPDAGMKRALLEAQVANAQRNAAGPQPDPNAELRRQLLAAQVEAAQAAAEKARKGNAGANIGDAKTQARLGNLNALGNQLKRVRSLWEKSLKGGMPNVIAGNIPEAIRPENGAFESAAAGLGEIGLAAFRVPGVGSQSDAELRQFVNANTPHPGDSDAKIEEKLRNLENRLGSTLEAMGHAPKKEGRDDAPAAYIGSDGQYTTEAGQHRDPRLSGVEGQYRQMLAKGEAPGKILQFLRSKGINANPQDVVEQARWLKQNPGKIQQLDTSQIEMVWRDKITRNTLGIDPESGLGAYGVAAGNALTAGTLDELAGMTGGNQQDAQIAKEVLRARNPGASLAGDVSGAALGMTGVNAGLRFAGGRLAGLATKAGGLGGDALYGAAYGAGEQNDSRGRGALQGAGAAATGNLIGRGIVSGLGRTARGVSDPNVQYLNDRGINMTPGQIFGQSGVLGRTVRGIEDKLQSVPWLGDAISARRNEGLGAFNREAFRDALKPINGQLGDGLGQEAIGQAQELVGDAYGDALDGVTLRGDIPFVRQAGDAIRAGRQVPEFGADVDYLVRANLGPTFGPGRSLTGEGFQSSLQDIAETAADFRKAGNVRGRNADKSMRGLRQSYLDLASRQAPGTNEALLSANAANRNVSILGDAVNRQGGDLFTPRQLEQAAIANTKKFGGKKAAARGDYPFADLAGAGNEILPSTVPNSGTTDRALATFVLPAALGGAATGSEAMGLPTPVTATLGTLALMSTKKGNSLIQRMAVSRDPATRAIGEELLKRRRAGGMFGAGAAVPLLAGN